MQPGRRVTGGYSCTVDEMSRGAAMAVSWADTDTVRVVQHGSWDALVRRLETDITYHSLGYHEASAAMEAVGTVPVLLHYQGDKAEMAIPLLLRPLPDNQGWDATSAYGFGGPVSTSKDRRSRVRRGCRRVGSREQPRRIIRPLPTTHQQPPSGPACNRLPSGSNHRVGPSAR